MKIMCRVSLFAILLAPFSSRAMDKAQPADPEVVAWQVSDREVKRLAAIGVGETAHVTRLKSDVTETYSATLLHGIVVVSSFGPGRYKKCTFGSLDGKRKQQSSDPGWWFARFKELYRAQCWAEEETGADKK